MRNASDVIIKIKNTITARLKIKTSLSRSNLQVLISNLVYRISRIRTTLQRHGNANKFSMAKHLRYFDLHLPVHTHVHTYILERRGLKRGVRSFRGIRGEYLVVFHPLEMDTLEYPFLKRFLFSFRGTPGVLYHIYGSIRFNVYPLDRDNALFLFLSDSDIWKSAVQKIFAITFLDWNSGRMLPLTNTISWLSIRFAFFFFFYDWWWFKSWIYIPDSDLFFFDLISRLFRFDVNSMQIYLNSFFTFRVYVCYNFYEEQLNLWLSSVTVSKKKERMIAG